jgi:hypothetical protein
MTPSDENASGEAGELLVGDVVRLREPHEGLEAGTRGRIIGFYGTDPRDVLLALDGGGELRAPSPKLERLPSPGPEPGSQESDNEGRDS